MRSPESECTSLALFLLSFHLFPPTRSLGRECPSLSLAFLLCLQSSLPMRSPESVCLALSPSSHVLTCLSRCTPQLVSAPRSLAFSPCPHLSLMMRSPECECPSLSRFLFVSSCPSLCTPQTVSAPFSLAFFSCPHFSLPLCFPVRECPSLARSLFFYVLTCPSRCALQLVSNLNTHVFSVC